MADVVRRGALRRSVPGQSGPVALSPTGFDAEVLDVIDAAVAGCVPTGVLLPVGDTNAPVVTVAAMFVRHLDLTRERTARVALVSRDLGHRSFYRSLHFGSEPLQDHFPLQVVKPGGKLSPVGDSARFLDGRFRVSTDIDRLIAVGESHDGIVVESGAADPAGMERLVGTSGGAVPVVYFATNPFDPVLDTLGAGGAVWAWSPDEIRRLSNQDVTDRPICADPAILAAAADTVYVVTTPDGAEALDKALAALWDDLRALALAAPAGDARVRWAWNVASAIAGCPVPAGYHDLQAGGPWGPQRFEDAPGRAETFARNARGDLSDYFDMLAVDLDTAVKELWANPKAGLVLQWVEHVDRDDEGLILTRNRTTVQALEDYLDDSPMVDLGWRSRIRVASFSDLENGRVGWRRKALLTGAVPHRRAGLVAMPAAEEIVITSHGPWESTRIVNQLRSVAAKLSERLGVDVRRRSHETLFGQLPERGYEDVEVVPVVRWDTVEPEGVPDTARGATWSPLALPDTRTPGLDDEDDTARIARTPAGRGSGEADTLKVAFDDGVGFFEPDLMVSRIRAGQEKDAAVKSLRAGDRVVLVDRGARSDLFDTIVSRLEDLPEYATIAGLVRTWQARVSNAKTGDLTFVEILRRMQEEGSRLTTAAAINHWVAGRTQGPQDYEDIRRFGAAVGDEFLQRHWRRLGQALDRMRIHRRSLGRQLARVLEEASPSDDDGYFDRRLGVHMSDLTETLSIHVVESVASNTVTVPGYLANVLLTPEEAGALERGAVE